MNNKRILIVDDEKPLVDILKFNLEKEGYKTLEAYDGEEAVEVALREKPDFIILDVMLPKLDGFTVCKKIRQFTNCPILMLTAKEEVVDKIIGLELGADDYMTKPYSFRELMARIKANFRKTGIQETNTPAEDANRISIGDMYLDAERYAAVIGHKIIDLTTKEFETLKLLAINANQVHTREQILRAVWGYAYYGDARTVDVTIRRLREKLTDPPSNKYIKTKRGMGYYIAK